MRHASIGMTDFLGELLAFESGIDLRRHRWYRECFDEPVMDYFQVERCGRIRRDRRSGEPLRARLSIRQYFEAIGVAHLYDPADPSSLVPMQYASINPWGFVGFQFGEAALIDIGYYTPKRVRVKTEGGEIEAPSYYVTGTAHSEWRNGRLRVLLLDPGGGEAAVLATDCNCWEGSFTGQDGLNSFADLRREPAQSIIIMRLIRRNIVAIEAALGEEGAKLADLCRGRVTLSGVIAAAHLTGPAAVARYLLGGGSAHDEAGTTLESYMERFGGFDVTEDLAANGGATISLSSASEASLAHK